MKFGAYNTSIGVLRKNFQEPFDEPWCKFGVIINEEKIVAFGSFNTYIIAS